MTRRRFTHLTMSGMAFLMSLSADRAQANIARSEKAIQTMGLRRPSNLGTTFSQLQCHYMGLDYRETFRQICSLGFNRIRLCSYWHEIEPAENEFNFTTLDWLLEESHRHGIEVALTVGMKAPRWPEFHFPDWLHARQDTATNLAAVDFNPEIADRALNFTQAVVNHVREAPALKYWQIENEPFTRLDITAGRYLSYEFVRRETALVRSLATPNQKLLMTTAISLPAANLAEDDRAFQESVDMADAVGINVYTKVPAGNSLFYLQPLPPYWDKLKAWQTSLADSNKEDWIAEAQAEPWEPNQLVAMAKAEYPSCTPKRTSNLVKSLTDLGYNTVMLWGCEYWYWQKKNDRNLWWWTMQQIVQSSTVEV